MRGVRGGLFNTPVVFPFEIGWVGSICASTHLCCSSLGHTLSRRRRREQERLGEIASEDTGGGC